MKTLKILNGVLLVLAVMLAVTAIFAFVNGNIIDGICNILWTGCEVVFFSINKKIIQIKQDTDNIYAFLLDINNTIETYGSAIITEADDGTWRLSAGVHDNTSCSAENNDQIVFGNNSNVGDKK